MIPTVLLAAALLVAGAVCVAGEHALVAARRTRLEELAEAGARRALRAVALREDLERSLRAARLGAVLSAVGFGAVVVPPAAGAFASLLRGGLSLSAGPAAVLAAVLAFLAVAAVYLPLGRTLPRTAALARPEPVLLAAAGPLVGLRAAARPLLSLGSRFERRRREDGRERIGPEEMEALLRGVWPERGVERDEEAMIHGVFELNRTITREVMTPRPDIVAFPEEAALSDVLATIAESGLSRFPVYGESIDAVTGILLAKDLLGWMRGGEERTFRLAEIARPPFFVPDSKPVGDLLGEFRRSKVHMAIVVDEFGGTDGVVTLEDLVEEIVGDIFDEHDVAAEEIVRLPDGRLLLDGGAGLADVMDEFGLEDVEGADEYDTVAGYAIGRLGRIPDVGEVVRVGRAELEVLETHEQRVTRLELRPRPATGEGAEEPDGIPSAPRGEKREAR
ncbi:MAG: hemolysin family protein [Gemmatimonadota bacterium]|nr:hemolysin family protein [Gemmatimonadota bacterium]